jgi:FkbM family methyltransferase
MSVVLTHPTGCEVILDLAHTGIDIGIVRSIIEMDEYGLTDLVDNGHDIKFAVDAGCHVGAFTKLVKLLWPEAKVLAIDPSPVNASVFAKNTQGLDGIYWYQKAAVDSDESFVHMTNAQDTGSGYIVETVDRLRDPSHRAKKRTTFEVQATRISKLLTEHQFPYIDILKVDTEGAEAEIFRDLRRSQWIKKTGWIRFEWYGRASIPLIEESLLGTHTIWMQTDYGLKCGRGCGHNGHRNYRD